MQFFESPEAARDLNTIESAPAELHRKMAALEEANCQLRETNRSLEKSIEALRQFAHFAAHDLQEPLRNIVNAADMVARKLNSGAGKEATFFSQECIDSAKRMQAMIKDLLTYATAVEQSDECHERVDAGEALRDALANLESIIQGTGAEIECAPLPLVHVHKTHLIQLFQNLIGNALKFRREAVIPSICVNSRPDGEQWLFAVEDNGIGFNPDYAEKIFKIFRRLHAPEEYPGAGIGLAICSRIVTHYGGKIWAQGNPGQGATFFFTLPG